VKRKTKTKTKTTMTKRHSRPIKAQTRWKLVSEELLTFNEVNTTSVNADSNVKRTKGKPKWLATPEAEQKRLDAIRLRHQLRKDAREASKRYMEKHGLKCISARIPTNIVDSFQYICEKEGLCRGEVIARLLNGFIQRNSYPNTK
jgi:hypothetical protein